VGHLAQTVAAVQHSVGLSTPLEAKYVQSLSCRDGELRELSGNINDLHQSVVNVEETTNSLLDEVQHTSAVSDALEARILQLENDVKGGDGRPSRFKGDRIKLESITKCTGQRIADYQLSLEEYASSHGLSSIDKIPFANLRVTLAGDALSTYDRIRRQYLRLGADAARKSLNASVLIKALKDSVHERTISEIRKSFTSVSYKKSMTFLDFIDSLDRTLQEWAIAECFRSLPVGREFSDRILDAIPRSDVQSWVRVWIVANPCPSPVITDQLSANRALNDVLDWARTQLYVNAKAAYPCVAVKNVAQKPEKASVTRCSHCRRRGHNADRCRRRPGASTPDAICSSCGVTGHVTSQCTVPRQAKAATPAKKPAASSSARGTPTCHECGQLGHIRPDCPTRKKKKNSSVSAVEAQERLREIFRLYSLPSGNDVGAVVSDHTDNAGAEYIADLEALMLHSQTTEAWAYYAIEDDMITSDECTLSLYDKRFALDSLPPLDAPGVPLDVGVFTSDDPSEDERLMLRAKKYSTLYLLGLGKASHLVLSLLDGGGLVSYSLIDDATAQDAQITRCSPPPGLTGDIRGIGGHNSPLYWGRVCVYFEGKLLRKPQESRTFKREILVAVYPTASLPHRFILGERDLHRLGVILDHARGIAELDPRAWPRNLVPSFVHDAENVARDQLYALGMQQGREQKKNFDEALADLARRGLCPRQHSNDDLMKECAEVFDGDLSVPFGEPLEIRLVEGYKPRRTRFRRKQKPMDKALLKKKI
jgi:hypothetical protein